ncbi:MAG: hypothetical protein EKK51_00170 [Mycolicibacterium sp.]|uniref:hypothetical protein n=1 Tax=Mycolicibacterium sp. TaxID=2320850 RepID=UPI000FA08135|nr:hypothetical protein [Mycolicibacterium sp.]RUP35008.1 MAG: hypothetical protein EKK51_00170 [Mycolicibacterium sp.]
MQHSFIEILKVVGVQGADSGRRGYSTEGDVLVSHTTDRVDLNVVWDTIREATNEYNAKRSALTSLLTFSTTNFGDAVPQSTDTGSFEEASEYGIAQSARVGGAIPLGYDFKDYDRRGAFTWKFLRGATAKQVYAVANDILSSDIKLTTGTILRRLFNPTQGTNELGTNVYPLWNGDSMVPPTYLGTSFAAPHSHYLASGAALLDSEDVEVLINHVQEHAYGLAGRGQLLILANRVESQVIQGFRAGVENQNTKKARFDFVPSALAPAFLTTEHIIGTTAPDNINGLPCQGSYGPALLIESPFIPAGYVAVVATGGPNSSINPIAFREHEDPAYQGLRHIAGPGQYPLSESHFQRSFGVGVRHRGAAACMQVTTNASYTAPTALIEV